MRDCTIKTFTSRVEAELVKGFLKANGIESYIKADDAGEMYPQFDRTAGVKLLVAQTDRRQAAKLLKTNT